MSHITEASISTHTHMHSHTQQTALKPIEFPWLQGGKLQVGMAVLMLKINVYIGSACSKAEIGCIVL